MIEKNYIILFRVVMLSSVICSIVGILFAVLLLETLPYELVNYISDLEAKEPSSMEMFLGLFGIVTIIILLPTITIGLWFFKRWAFLLLIGLTFFTFFLYPFFGPIIMTPWEALFTDLSLMFSGATIVMVIFPPIKEKFKM